MYRTVKSSWTWLTILRSVKETRWINGISRKREYSKLPGEVYTYSKGNLVSTGDKVCLLTGAATGDKGNLVEIVQFTKRYIKVKLVSKRVTRRLGKNLELIE